MKKRLLAMFLVLTLCVGLLPVSAFAAETEDGSSPPDTPEQISAVLATETSYTRGQWLQALEELFGLTADTAEYPDVYFPDVEGTEYFDVVMIATACGLADVEAGDDFRPEGNLTRDFAVHTLNFMLGMEKTSEDYTFSDSRELDYPDDAQAVLDAGWLTLVDGAFQPDRSVDATEAEAMLAGAGAILDSRNAFQPRHDYEFASYVKILPDSVEVESDFDMETNARTVTISGYDGTLAEGDVFVYYYEDYAFVFAAKSVDQADGVYVVETEAAPEGAILKYEYSGSLTPEITEFVPTNDPVTLMDADGSTVTFGEVRAINIKNNEITLSQDVFKSNGLSGTLNGKIRFDGLDVDIWGSEKRAVLNGTIEISSTIQFDVLNDPNVSRGLELGGIKLSGFGYVGLVLNLKMKAEISYSWSASFRVGAEYANNTGSLIKEINPSANNCFSAKGEVSAQIALTAYIDLGPAGYARASLGAGPVMKMGMKAYSSGTPQTCINLSGYFYAGAEFSVKFVNPFTSKTIYEINKSWEFYGEKNSPVRVVEHIEDGMTVGSCTRGGDSGTTTDGYTTPKYVSPANSRYYASSNPNGSGTWIGSGGEPVVIWITEDNEDGTVTVTGYSGGASVLNIPETIDGKTVTAIGSRAFWNNTAIRIVKIPDTVTSIGADAFNGCANLQIVTFSKNLTRIGSHAFSNCVSLTRADLPEGLITLGGFAGCTSLKEVYIPSSLEESSNYTSGMITNYRVGSFEDCTSLTNVTFGENLTTIPAYLFADCPGLTNITIPDSVTEIESYAFNGCANLQTVTFSKSLTRIGNHSFSNCTALLRADLPEGLTTLGGFVGCTSLKEVYIPSSLRTSSNYTSGTITNYQVGSFEGCTSLTDVTFGENLTTIPAYLFANCPGIIDITIPDSVTEIESYAFNGCANLQTVTFSKSLTRIGNHSFSNCTALLRVDLPEGLTTLGGFVGCTSLKEVYIPSSLKTSSNYTSGTITNYQVGSFEDCTSLTNVTFGENLTAIPAYLFANCPGITNITIPDSVTEIESYAFNGCANLQTVTFSKSLTRIGNHSFSNCTALLRADLPEGLTTLGGFVGCTSLKEVYIPSSLKTSSNYTSGTITNYQVGSFEDCTSLTNVTFGEGLATIPAYLFRNCTGLTNIKVPDTVTSIGNNAFYGCTNLASIQIPDSVTSIGSSAFISSGLVTITIPDTVTQYPNALFQNCVNLTNAKLSDTALSIPASMFSGCTALETVELPDGVTEIKSSTFYNCTALENLDFLPDSVTIIGTSAFEGCTGITVAKLPDAVTELGYNAFRGCTALTSFEAGYALKIIGSSCFQDCSALMDVKLNNNLETIGAYAFQNCAALEEIVLPDSVTAIGSYCFQKNPKLASVTLSKGLAEIPSYAFANCTTLEQLDIPYGVKTIKDHAFYQDTKLKTFTIPESVIAIEDNAFSYAATTTVYGVSGSYAETYAKWEKFIPIEPAVSVTKVTLDKETADLEVGKTIILSAAVEPEDATNSTVTWSTNRATIATVDQNGKVTGVRAGTAVITATTRDGDITATCTVTVTASQTVETEVKLSSLTLSAGTLTPDFNPDVTSYTANVVNSVTSVTIAATGADGANAVVKKDGVVCANGEVNLTEGTNNVTITVTKGTATKDYTITITRSAASQVVASAADVTAVYDGANHGITVTVTNPTQGFTVTYSNAADGIFTANQPECIDAGTYTIWYKVTATGMAEFIGSAKVTITKAVGLAAPTGLTGVPCATEGNQDGKIIGLTAGNYEISSNNGTTWTAATVTAGGVIENLKPGTYWVRVKQDSNHETNAYVAVTIIPYGVTAYNITISSNIVNGTISANASAAEAGDVITLTVTPNSGYRLKTGSLKANNVAVNADAEGNYKFTMPAENVEITAEFEAITYSVTANLTHLTSNAPATVRHGNTLVIDLTATNGWKLPETVTVTMGGKPLSSGEGYIYSNGRITIASVTGTVVITAVGVEDSTVVNPPSPPSGPSTPVTPPSGPSTSAPSPTTTETKDNEDGTTTTIVTDNTTGTVTETTEKADGTVEVIETKKDGTVTKTVTKPEGDKIEKVTSPSKDVVITVTSKDSEVLAKVEIPAVIPVSKIHFVDVPEGHWAEEAINSMVALEIVNGVGGSRFDMNSGMTRGALATVLSRLSHGQEGLSANFADVAADKWYTDGIAWAAKTGIVTGYSATEFGPEDTITREQLAVMLCRYARLLGIDTTADSVVLNDFNDGSSTHEWAADSIAWCVANGILQGKGKGILAPTATATRAEVVIMLQRFINLVK